MPSRHAENFPPSGAHRWINCPGSIGLCKRLGVKNTVGMDAHIGTAAHALLAMAIDGVDVEQKMPGKLIPVEQDDGVKLKLKVDDRMMRGVLSAMDVLAPRLSLKWHGSERWMDIPETGEGGTTDFWAYDHNDDVVYVDDYKNGRVPVVARRNPQLMLYALGVLAYLRGRKIIKPNSKRKIVLGIIGPNFSGADKVRSSWTTTEGELTKWASERVKPAVEAHNDGTARCIPGDWCSGCPGRGRCAALAKYGAAQARMEFADFIKPKADAKPMKPKESAKHCALLSDRQLAGALKSIKLLMAMHAKAAEEAMRRLASDPNSIPGFKLVESSPRRCWKDEDAAQSALLRAGLRRSDFLRISLCGIGDALSLLPKERRDAFAKRHTMTPRGSPTLAMDTDPRPALSNAKIDFSDEIEERED